MVDSNGQKYLNYASRHDPQEIFLYYILWCKLSFSTMKSHIWPLKTATFATSGGRFWCTV